MDFSSPSSSYRSSCLPEEEEEEEREHMFDKVVTPSDVGKLNRLVIPKQQAEKYFPLDSSSTEKGLLLDFEDRSGKSWRFRYSYWNSSQSYVMTKGWSRFVKDKKLDAGDVVSFHRRILQHSQNHFYIDWRRRPQPPPPPQIQFQHGYRSIRYSPFPPPPIFHHRPLTSFTPYPNHHRGTVISYSNLDNAATNSSGYSTDNYKTYRPNLFPQGGPLVYMTGPPPQMQIPSDEPMVLDSVPVVQSSPTKRLRLFGINMDCQDTWTHPSSPSSGSLELSLIHGGTETTATESELQDKGKSSMSLDLDLS